MNKVTVLMPVSDSERFIKQSISSILDQTYHDFELLIVDDVANSETQGIVQGFKDKRIRILKNKTKLGVAASLNRGISNCNSTYVARMDADDIALPNRLEKQIEFLESNLGCDLVTSWVEVIDANGKVLKVEKTPKKYKDLKKLLLKFNCIRHSSVIIRKEILDKYGKYDEELDGAEDYDLWLRLVKHTTFYSIPKKLLKYRLSKSSVSYTNNRRIVWAHCRAKIKAVFKYKHSAWILIYSVKSVFSLLIPLFVKRLIYRKVFHY